MRHTFALALIVLLLAVSGAVYFLFGRPDTTRAIETPAAVAGAEREAARAPESVTAPEARPESAVPAASERTHIAAAPAPAPAPAKSAGTTLAGRLVDGAGAPVAGVEVRASQGEFEMIGLDVAGMGRALDRLKTTTDATGRFEIAGIQPGSARLTARAPGYVPLSKSGIGIPAAPRHDVGDLALETSVILEGRVVDARGVGVAGARIARASTDGVMAFEFSGDWSQRAPALATTAADGSFRIDQLATGPWRLRITSDAHPDKTENGLTRRPGELVTGLRFVLEDGFEISGRVDGVPPAALADASVVALPPAGTGENVFVGGEELAFGEGRRRAQLEPGGTFTLRGLRAGAYQLQARVKSGQGSFWPRSASERVEAKTGDNAVVIAWQPASVLAFQAVDAETKQPIEQLEVDAGTRGAPMFLDPTRRGSERYENGIVRIDDLRPRDANDRAVLDVSATGYKTLHREDIVLARGQETDLGVLELEKLATIAVRVVDAGTRGGIANATVSLRLVEEEGNEERGMFRARRAVVADFADGEGHFSGFGDSATARTDADGWARLNSTPGRRGKLSVKADGYAPFVGEEFELPDRDVDQLVALDQGGSVEITLLSADGTAPVAGARIDHRGPESSDDPFAAMVGPMGRGKGAATDAEGKVTFANLAPGVHRFRPAKGGGELAEGAMVFTRGGAASGGQGWTEIEVARGATAALELREPARTLVEGRVREGGSPLAGASLSLRRRGGEPGLEGLDDLPFGGGGPRAKTDGEGRYKFERVEAGSYDLVVRHATRSMPARFPVEVDQDGLEYDVDLQVSVIEGRVRDGEGKPVAGARVWAERKRGSGESREFRAISVVADAGDAGGVVFDSSGQQAARGKTDEDGRYTLRGVEHDVELQVRVEAKDCEPTRSAPVQVALGQTRTGVDVEVSPAGEIKVRVAQAAGATPAPCLVHAEYLDPAPEGKRIDPKIEFAQGGAVALRGLRPGRWKLFAESLGGFGGGEENRQGEATEVVVVAHETVQVELAAP